MILNLVMNAIQAVAAMDVDRRGDSGAHPGERGDSVVLEVTGNNGPGMPIEISRPGSFSRSTTINKTSGMGLGFGDNGRPR